MILEEFSKIKAVVLDVDGVLTNGQIQVLPDGSQIRTFNVKDGYAMQYAVKQGLLIFVITGAKCEGVKRRMNGLGIEEVFLGISDKLPVLNNLLEKYNLNYSEVLYMGDDLPDYKTMQQVKIAVCPADAVEEIKSISHYISPHAGGAGAVRDILEKILKLQQRWEIFTSIKSI